MGVIIPSKEEPLHIHDVMAVIGSLAVITLFVYSVLPARCKNQISGGGKDKKKYQGSRVSQRRKSKRKKKENKKKKKSTKPFRKEKKNNYNE